MPATRTAGARNGAGRVNAPKLPPITVAKLEETGKLLERVVAENQAMFVAKGQAYREIHQQGASRSLSAAEAAQVAVMLSEEGERLERAQQVQQSGLRAYDEPQGREILMAAGLGAAPAFLEAVRRAVALVEMPLADFEEACEEGALPEAIDERAQGLRKLELGEARKRASAAFTHYATAAGFEPGEAWRLPAQAVWQALSGAVSQLAEQASQSAQLIDSAASTEASGAERSSTA